MNKKLSDIEIEIVNEHGIDKALKFQKRIIDNMVNKDHFCPLTKEEFLTPILNKDNVYFLKNKNEIIALFVATCEVPEILKEYKLNNYNIMLIDSIMVSEKFRGYGLQRQILEFLSRRAKELQLDGLVATIHPNNVYSLNNFISSGYEIINKLNIHGGPRYIVYKNIK